MNRQNMYYGRATYYLPDPPKPPKKHKKTFMEKVAGNWKDFKKFIWNIEKGTIFGRTPLGWLKFLTFLFVLYSFLLGVLFLLTWLRMYTLPSTSEGPLRTNYLTFRGPGLNVVPYGRRMERVYEFNPGQSGTYQYFYDRMTEFISNYITVDGRDLRFKFEECTPAQSADCGVINDDDRPFVYFDSVKLLANSSVMAYNMFNLGDCYNDFGFANAEPCFFLTINKVWGWKPSRLSPNSRKDERYIGMIDQLDDAFVPIVCQGKGKKDQEWITGIEIYPEKGFYRDYFPWEGQKNYRPPIVAVQVKVNPCGYNKDIRVQCVILANNIFHTDDEKFAGATELKIRISDANFVKPYGCDEL